MLRVTRPLTQALLGRRTDGHPRASVHAPPGWAIPRFSLPWRNHHRVTPLRVSTNPGWRDSSSRSVCRNESMAETSKLFPWYETSRSPAYKWSWSKAGPYVLRFCYTDCLTLKCSGVWVFGVIFGGEVGFVIFGCFFFEILKIMDFLWSNQYVVFYIYG